MFGRGGCLSGGGELRREVCHAQAPGDGPREPDALVDHPGAFWMKRVQGHFQHASYFRRYGDFIRNCVLKSPAQMRLDHYRPFVKVLDKEADLTLPENLRFESIKVPRNKDPADLVVYIRLGKHGGG